MSGSLFELPGGDVGFAFGGEIRHEWRQSQEDHDSNQQRFGFLLGNTDAKAERNVYSGFAGAALAVLRRHRAADRGARRALHRHREVHAEPVRWPHDHPGEIAGRDNVPPVFRRLQIRGQVTAFRAPDILDASRISVVVPTQMQIGTGLPSFHSGQDVRAIRTSTTRERWR